jgi:predicted MPP superfamily phosphohydrolase
VLAARAIRGRRRWPAFAWTVLGAAVLGESCYLWARRVEPFRLELVHGRVVSPRLAGLAAPLRVAVVADLQTDTIGEYEVSVFDTLVAERPDLVLFAGDYLQVEDHRTFLREQPALRDQLNRLQPRLGMFAVGGDVDGFGLDRVFAGTAVQGIDDRVVSLADVPIDLIGLARMRSRAPFLDAGQVRKLQGERFPIVLGHAPDFMLAVVRDGLPADALFVAGHTHGGQVQVPGFGPVMTLSSVPRWLAAGGVFRHGASWLCCSRGIGMERGDAPRIRFWCRPQLIVLELAPPGAAPVEPKPN